MTVVAAIETVLRIIARAADAGIRVTGVWASSPTMTASDVRDRLDRIIRDAREAERREWEALGGPAPEPITGTLDDDA